MRYREKKLRGKQNKRKMKVSVSEITAEGFWLHTYKGDHYVSREKYHWFKDATDAEIQDVRVLLCLYDKNDNALEWSSLDLHFRIKFFEGG